MNFKRLFIFILLTLFLSTSAYSIKYNESFTDLTIVGDPWCANFEIEFKVYNKTDYDEKINDEEDRNNITTIDDAEVIVYNGPLDSLPVLYEGKSASNGTFKVTFPSPNRYFLSIEPPGDFNGYEDFFLAESCKWLTEEVADDSINKNETYSYLNSLVSVSLVDSNTASSIDISVNQLDDENLEASSKSFGGFNGDVEIYEILEARDFSTSSISLNLGISDSSKFSKVLRFNDNSNSWENVDGNLVGEEFFIEGATYGIYAIGYSAIDDVTDGSIEISSDESSEDSNDTVETVEINIDETPSDIVISEDGGLDILVIGVSLLVVTFLIAGYLFYYTGKHKHLKEAKEDHLKGERENLGNYGEVLENTKKYIEEYKDKFDEEKLRKALENAKVPKDIIDKAFSFEK